MSIFLFTTTEILLDFEIEMCIMHPGNKIMRLSTYLKSQKKEGLKQCAWAAKHKISPAVISRYLRGGGMSPANAFKVELATKGSVKAVDILRAIVKNNQR